MRLPRRLAYLLAAVAVVSGLGTFATMTKTSPFGEGAQAVLLFLYLDAILLLILSAIIIVRIVSVWVERRRGLAGSRLHSRLVVMFSVVAVTPAILVAIFSGFYLNFGIQDWFSERVRTAVEESLIVAQAYLHEHRQTIRADAFGMANDLNRDAAILVRRPQEFNKFMSNQAELRSLSEAVVIDSNGQVLARSALSFTLEFEPMPRAVVDQADKGDVVVLSGEGD
ncbi:MAG: sensor histidine kinase NtrY-like, partial [Rhodospirillales bacterium]